MGFILHFQNKFIGQEEFKVEKKHSYWGKEKLNHQAVMVVHQLKFLNDQK